MKRTLLTLLLLMVGVCSAQIVNIPDANFKAKLLNSSVNSPAALNANDEGIIVDTNGDGEIEESEALLVYKLHLSNANIASLDGIEYFTNVTELVAGYDNLTVVDLTALTNLKFLHISYNPMTTIHLEGLASLLEIYIAANQLTSLDLTGLTSVQRLDCGDNNFNTLEVSGLDNLKYLSLNDSYDNDLPIMQELILYDLPQIIELKINNCHLQQLDVSQITNLRWLLASDNYFTNLDLSALSKLTRIDLTNTSLTELDLGQAPLLQTCNIHHNTGLNHINLKNGSICNNYSIYENPNLNYICIDEGEETALASWLALYNLNDIQINTYCTFTPGGRYNTISGNIAYDSAGDGCDTSDTVINTFVQVNLLSENQQATYYTNTGNYNFYTGVGTFQLSPQINNEWFVISPSVGEVAFDSVENLTTIQDFCISANGVHPDAEVVIMPLNAAQPGFDATYKIVYKNKGNQTLSGDVIFTYNDDVLDYVSALPTETSSASGSLTWSYSNLLPFESREITVALNVNGPMETPAVNIGNELQFWVTVNPVTDDETPDDNVFGLKQTVIGSLDPNDITCLEGTVVSANKIGEYLHYNINFENTGTAPATFVAIKDIIDTAKYDIGTLQVLNASHAMEARITGNKAEFYFDNINLEANGGKGNVAFKIKTLNSLAVNSSVTQQADIYFDYNWPIVTNEATTTFAVLSTDNLTKETLVKLYPNPAKNIVNITAQNTIQAVQLYDIQGRLLQAANANGLTATVDVSGRRAGIYFIKVSTDKGTAVEKLVKE